MRHITSILALACVVGLSGCVLPEPTADEINSQLTQGNIQLNLKKGVTTKAEVLEKFGAPNITTRDGAGREVWTYQRAAQVSRSSTRAGYWTIILAGQSGRNSGFKSSSRMITLIIKFDSKDVVADFRSRASNF